MLTAAVQIDPGSASPVSLTAAAQILTSRRISDDPKRGGRRRPVRGRGDWQAEVWQLLDEVGELWFAGSWLSAALSRTRIVAAKQLKNGDEPRVLGATPSLADGDLSESSGGSASLPVAEPESDDDQEVARLVSRWAGGIAGQEQFLARAGWHLGMVGESYFVATANPLGVLADDDVLGTGADDLSWMAYSDRELAYAQDGWRLTDAYSGVAGPLPADSLVVRAWRPHPCRFSESSSATRAALPILRELRGLTMHVSAQIDSRLAGAGMLLLPQSMTFLSGGQSADLNSGEDPFVEALIEAMVTPIRDRDSAAAVVPIVIRVPDESIGKAQYLRFGDTQLDNTAKSLREEAIHRLALSLDIPQEIVTGLGDSNHWSAWQVDESAIKLHVAPVAAVLCHALTVGWLHPLLTEMGVPDALDYLVWFDTTPLVLRPDRSGDAKELYDRAAVGAAALRRETGFSEADAPSDTERREQLLIRIVERAPTLAPVVLPLLGIQISPDAAAQGLQTVRAISGINPDGLDAQGRQATQAEDPIRDARRLTADERALLEPDARDRGQPDRPTSMAASAVGDVQLEACHVAVLRALEYAGKRMVFGSRSQQTHLRALQQDNPYRMHMLVPVGDRSLDHLLDGAWSCLVAARDDHPSLQPILDAYVRLLLQHQVEHSRDYLRAALLQAAVHA